MEESEAHPSDMLREAMDQAGVSVSDLALAWFHQGPGAEFIDYVYYIQSVLGKNNEINSSMAIAIEEVGLGDARTWLGRGMRYRKSVGDPFKSTCGRNCEGGLMELGSEDSEYWFKCSECERGIRPKGKGA